MTAPPAWLFDTRCFLTSIGNSDSHQVILYMSRVSNDVDVLDYCRHIRNLRDPSRTNNMAVFDA